MKIFQLSRLLLRVWHQVRGKLLPFALILAAVVGFFMWPRTSPAGGRDSAGAFNSSGTLLLPARARVILAALTVVRGQNELQYWLVNEEMFRQLLVRKRVFERIEDRLAQKFPTIAGRSHTVNIFPMFSVQLDPDEIMGDYAVAEGSDALTIRESSFEKGRGSANRVIVLATAADAEGSAVVARVGLEILQKALAETATQRVRRELQSIDKYIVLTKRRIAKAEQSLRAVPTSDMEGDALGRIALLQVRVGALTADTERLEKQIEMHQSDQLLSAQMGSNPLRAELDKINMERSSAASLYQPDSTALQAISEKLERFRRAVLRRERDLADGATAQLSAELRAKQGLLAEARQELRSWLKLAPSERDKRAYLTKGKELTTWETELLEWERRRLKARIEENLCSAEGTSVVLLSPLKGKEVAATPLRFAEKYKKSLKLLPLVPLAIAALGFLVFLVKEASRVRRRAEYYLDAPVLVQLPRVLKTSPDGSRGFTPFKRSHHRR